MKILHITASYKPAYIYGGPIMSVAKLCEELEKSRNFSKSIIVYTTLANGTEELPYPPRTVKIVDGVEIHYFKRLTKDHSHFSPALYWKLWKDAKQYDIIHIHAWWNLVSMISCCIALFKSIKVIITPRGTLSNYSFYNRSSKVKRCFHKTIGSWLLNKCHFHLTSEKEAQDTRQLLKPKSLTVIPNFVELPLEKVNQFKQKKPSTNGTFKLIFLSRIEQKKGIELLFQVISTLPFPWYLRIAGTGDETYIKSLKQMATTLGIQDNITWLGMLNNDKKFEEIHHNDIFILPSFDENFANVVIESLFSGTPVLITKNVGLSDYIEKKQLGWTCERNSEALKTAIEKAKSTINSDTYNPSYLIETIIKDYKEGNLTANYLEMYNQIIQQEGV